MLFDEKLKLFDSLSLVLLLYHQVFLSDLQLGHQFRTVLNLGDLVLKVPHEGLVHFFVQLSILVPQLVEFSLKPLLSILSDLNGALHILDSILKRLSLPEHLVLTTLHLAVVVPYLGVCLSQLLDEFVVLDPELLHLLRLIIGFLLQSHKLLLFLNQLSFKLLNRSLLSLDGLSLGEIELELRL